MDVRTLDGWVPAAAQWIKYCGREIYDKTGFLGAEWPSKWSGEAGWSKERWGFWKERFAWIAKVTALDRSTRNTATDMVVLMNQIEEEVVEEEASSSS